jgi:hypothetical protein
MVEGWVLVAGGALILMIFGVYSDSLAFRHFFLARRGIGRFYRNYDSSWVSGPAISEGFD